MTAAAAAQPAAAACCTFADRCTAATGMLCCGLKHTSRLLASQRKCCRARWQSQQAAGRMSCSTAITVAFKSPAQQQEFASFKLVSTSAQIDVLRYQQLPVTSWCFFLHSGTARQHHAATSLQLLYAQSCISCGHQPTSVTTNLLFRHMPAEHSNRPQPAGNLKHSGNDLFPT